MPYDRPGTGLDLPTVDLSSLIAERGEPPWRLAVVAGAPARVVLLGMTPGTVTIPHYHPRASELFQVVKGVVGLTVGDEEHLAVPGSLVYAPCGVRHQIRVPGPDPAVLMCVVAPNEDAPDEQVDVE
jgi:quercetin dioxygenase-like cupin family protein